MTVFDLADAERRGPSAHTPRCPMCDEAGMPRYGGFCHRHAISAAQVGLIRPVA